MRDARYPDVLTERPVRRVIRRRPYERSRRRDRPLGIITRFNCLINPDDVLGVLSGCSLGEPSTMGVCLCIMRENAYVCAIQYVCTGGRGGGPEWPHIRAMYVNCRARYVILQKALINLSFSKLDLFAGPQTLFFSLSLSLAIFIFFRLSVYLYRIRDARASSRKTNKMGNDTIDMHEAFKCGRSRRVFLLKIILEMKRTIIS